MENRELDRIPDIRSRIALNSNMYSVITGTEAGFSDAIDDLRSERNNLVDFATEPDDVIKSDRTGYFVSYADGYEETLKTTDAGNLSESDIRDIIKGGKSAPANAIGKTFDSYNCKIVGIVKADSRITDDAEVSLKLNSSRTVYNCTVDSVKMSGDNMIIVLDCDRVDQTLVNSRVLSAKLIFDEYQGIKVPRSALRFRGDEKGVYVILGKDISFKKIKVIYEGDDFVLSENTSDEDYLLLYDQILLEVVSNKDVSVNSETDGDTVSSE